MKWINRDIQTVFRVVGFLLHIPGVMAVLLLPVCFAFHEDYAILPFGLTTLVSFGLRQILCHWFRRTEEVNLQHAMLIVALSWAIMGLS
jgi:trk system potassium uptake protein TrkH